MFKLGPHSEINQFEDWTQATVCVSRFVLPWHRTALSHAAVKLECKI